MTETPRVEAFIQAKQDAVLARARDTVATTPDSDLGAQIHRLIGTLGTFSLDDAVAALRPLDALLKQPDEPSAAELADARSTAGQALSAIIARRLGEG